MADATAAIHPSAVVEPGATLGAGVRIGPFCHVGAEAVLGDNVELMGHVSISGATMVGEGTRIFPMAALGGLPQTSRHAGGRTTLSIGRNCTIREFVTMHVGSDSSRGATVIGDNCQFLAYSHVAHDCIIGNNVTMTNCATLGGHCEIGDGVGIGGLTAVHQFVRVGAGAFLAGCSAVVGDVIPYGMASGNRATLRGFNIIGLKRAGFDRDQIYRMREAYRLLFDPQRPFAENLEAVAASFQDAPAVMRIVDFLQSRGKRQYTLPPRDRESRDGDEDI